MKTKIILPFLLTAALLLAADYDSIIAGDETQYEEAKTKVTKVVQAITPVGADVANKGKETIFVSAISPDGISIGYARPELNAGSNASTNTTAHFGHCKINSEIVTRFDNNTPAIRIKLLSVDMEHGTATLIVTKFWPWPNSTATKELDPSTNPEAEPVKH